MSKRDAYYGGLERNTILPFLSTLNFQMENLYVFLEECSVIPQGKESISSWGVMHYSVFGVTPTGAEDFEASLRKIASRESKKGSGVCLRTWKVVLGGDLPRYFVAVFADTEKEAEKWAGGLELGKGPVRDVLRSQKEGVSLLRSDLSFNGPN